MRYTFLPNATLRTEWALLKLYHTKPSFTIGGDIPVIVVEFALEKGIPVVWDWDGLCDTIEPARLQNAVMSYNSLQARTNARAIAIHWVNREKQLKDKMSVVIDVK